MGLFRRNKGETVSGLGTDVVDAETHQSIAPGVIDAGEGDAEIDSSRAEAAGVVAELEDEVKSRRFKLGRRARAGKVDLGKDPVDASDAEAEPKMSRAERRAAKAIARADKAAIKKGVPADPALDARLSVRVMIDFLQGVSKEDAVEWARRWATTHMDVPSDCFFAVQKYGPKNGGGFAVEVQEGVGRSYLPSVVDLAMAHPGRIVSVPMSRRKLTVVYSPRIEEFDAQVLPEGMNPPAGVDGVLEAVRGPSMIPIMKLHMGWLYSGVAMTAAGMLFLMSSLGLYAFDPKVRIPPDWTVTETRDLPVMQWSRLQAGATDSYVVRMEYTDGQWRVVRQAAGAGADIAPGSADTAAAISALTPGGGNLPTGVAPGAGNLPTGVLPPPGGAAGLPPPSAAGAGAGPQIPPPAGAPQQ